MTERLHQRLRTLAEVVEESGGRLALGTLRSWIHTNRAGFRDRVVIRPGRWVLVDLDELERWLADQASTPARPRLTAARAEASVRPRFGRAGRC